MEAPREGGTARTNAPWWRLVADTAGTPSEMARKARRLARGLAGYARGGDVDARLARLHALGLIDAVPTRVQLAVGSFDMVRFWIVPASEDYYRRQGIDFRFHQLLRFLEEPLSLTDPVGLLSERDAIIGHVMQVVHANPCYDLQLLQMFEDGLEEMERQTAQMVAGTHPRARAIGAIVEEPDYHARLLDYVRAFRRDRRAPPIVRSNVSENPRWAALERTFGTLPAAMRYFLRMPRSPVEALVHALLVREFPLELAETNVPGNDVIIRALE